MALRELALRRTDDRVDDDVQADRSASSIEQVWKTEGAMLCCVGPQSGAERVARSAAQLARQLALTWHAMYVETPALQRLNHQRREAILQTVKLGEELGASTAVLSAQSVAQALVEHAGVVELAGSLTRPGQPRVAVEAMNPFKMASTKKGAKATKR